MRGSGAFVSIGSVFLTSKKKLRMFRILRRRGKKEEELKEKCETDADFYSESED